MVISIDAGNPLPDNNNSRDLEKVGASAQNRYPVLCPLIMFNIMPVTGNISKKS